MVDVRPLNSHELMQFYAPETHYEGLVVEGGEVLAVGGIAPIGARLWGFLNVKPEVVGMRWTLIRSIRARLKTLAHRAAVYAPCETAASPNAERLLRLLGFVPTDEFVDDLRVWVWRNLQS